MRISLLFVFVLLCAILLDDAIVLAKKNKQESEEKHYDERQQKNTKKVDHNRNDYKKSPKKEKKHTIEEVYEDDNSGEINYNDKRQKSHENTKIYKKNKQDKHSSGDSEEVQNKQKQKKPKKIDHHQQLIEEETNEESDFVVEENENICNCQRYKHTDKKHKENIYRKNPKEIPCEEATNGDSTVEAVRHKQKAHKTKSNPPGYYSKPHIVDETQEESTNDFCRRCSECFKEKHKRYEKRGRQYPRENFNEENTDPNIFNGELDFNL